MRYYMKKRKILLSLGICIFSALCLFLLWTSLDNEQTPPTESEISSESESDTEIESSTENEIPTESENPTETEVNTENDTSTETESSTENEPEVVEKTYLEQCELDYVEPPVKRTREEALEKIRELSLWFPALHLVYDNQEQYGNSIILALAGNPEMTDFAAGMLTRPAEVTGGFRDDELPENYPLFLQWDIRWGYMLYGNTGGNMGSSGCGPACLSMAIFYLTGNRECTPDVVAQYSMDNGYYIAGSGTAWSLLYDYPKLYNLNSYSLGKNEATMKAELDKGNILICSVREGNFTTGGHFILIYGYDEHGFKVNDPKCVYRSRLSWTYSQIKNDIKQTWSIGK